MSLRGAGPPWRYVRRSKPIGWYEDPLRRAFQRAGYTITDAAFESLPQSVEVLERLHNEWLFRWLRERGQAVDLLDFYEDTDADRDRR